MTVKAKPKILHFITGLEIGGAEKMLVKTLPLLELHFTNEVCCLRGQGVLGQELIKQGIPVHYIELKSLNSLSVLLKFRQVIKEFQPDLLVTYLIHADIVGRIFGRLFGIKKIVSNRRGFYLNWLSLQPLDRLTKSLVSQYIVQTNVAKQALMKTLGLPADKIIVIPNGIDMHDYQMTLDNMQTKAALHIPPDNLNIVCLSTLKPGKGHQELFSAFANIHASFPHTNLLIVGDGPCKDMFLKQVKDYSARHNIFFLGNRQDVPAILRISDIFVLPTHSEGMSNAILEAMASHLPIITTNIAVNQEMITDGVSGLLIDVKDTAALGNKLQFLITNQAARLSLGQHAYQKVLDVFTMDKYIATTIANYNHIIYAG